MRCSIVSLGIISNSMIDCMFCGKMITCPNAHIICDDFHPLNTILLYSLSYFVYKNHDLTSSRMFTHFNY